MSERQRWADYVRVLNLRPAQVRAWLRRYGWVPDQATKWGPHFVGYTHHQRPGEPRIGVPNKPHFADYPRRLVECVEAFCDEADLFVVDMLREIARTEPGSASE